MNLNKVFIIGRLTQDPETRSTQSGQSVTTVRMATNRVWTDKAGQKQEGAEFHTIVAWGRLGEIRIIIKDTQQKLWPKDYN